MNTPRRYSDTRGLLAAIAAAIPAMLIGSDLSAPPAQAAYIVTLEQMGTSVAATGSGTLDLTDLSGPSSGSSTLAQLFPADAVILTGPVSPPPSRR